MIALYHMCDDVLSIDDLDFYCSRTERYFLLEVVVELRGQMSSLWLYRKKDEYMLVCETSKRNKYFYLKFLCLSLGAFLTFRGQRFRLTKTREQIEMRLWPLFQATQATNDWSRIKYRKK